MCRIDAPPCACRHRYIPPCYGLLYDWLLPAEVFNEKECPEDDIWPCEEARGAHAPFFPTAARLQAPLPTPVRPPLLPRAVVHVPIPPPSRCVQWSASTLAKSARQNLSPDTKAILAEQVEHRIA